MSTRNTKQVRIDLAKDELSLQLTTVIYNFKATDKKAPELTNLDVIQVLSKLIIDQANE